jgi:hypothetical protein
LSFFGFSDHQIPGSNGNTFKGLVNPA